MILKLTLAAAWVAFCYFFIRDTARLNIKDKNAFCQANFIKKIDLIFTEEDDLLNANKKRSILSVILILALVVYLVISCFN